MRDDRYMSYDDGQGYEDYAPAGYEYEEAPRSRGEARRERPVRERPSRGSAPQPQAAGAGKVLEVVGGVAGSVAGAVSGVVGSVMGKVRNASEGRAQSRVEAAEDDYLGVGAPCRMCGNPVDRLQARCPHCGARVKPVYTQIPFIVAAVVLVALVVFLTMSINSCKLEQAENPGGTHAAPVVTDVATLQTMVADAEAKLAAQAVSHEYTRLSAFKAQQAVDAAKAVAASAAPDEQSITAAGKALSDAVSALAPVLAENSDYDWPYANEINADPNSFVDKQFAIAGVVVSVTWTTDGNPGWATITLNDGSTMGVGVYPADTTVQFTQGQQISAYGSLNTDGTTFAFWADKVEVF